MAGHNPLFGRDEGPRPPMGPYYTPATPYGPTWAATYPTNLALPPGTPIPPGPVYATNQPAGAYSPFTRYPNAPPPPRGSFPAAQMPNSTGGSGCEPGYNYFFASAYTKIHVFKSATPPWQLPLGAHIPFHAAHVPTGTTLAELLRGFGCDNPVPKKNRCYEIVQGGGGKWYKGMMISGDDKDVGRTTIRDVGWDESRTGQPGGKPVVCLYLTKD